MTGGLVQLAAAAGGPHADAVLAPDQRSFWRHAYLRPRNFAMESVPQTFVGAAMYGRRVTCAVGLQGDLLCGLTLEILLKRGAGDSFYAAEHLVREVELEIGGAVVDRLWNTWLRVYDELHRDADEREGYRQMVDFDAEPAGCFRRFYVKLPFWFARRDRAASLPLIALQFHAVKIHVTFERAESVPGLDPAAQPEARLFADFCYLDAAERRWFAQTPHRYLVEQTQRVQDVLDVAATPRTTRVDLPFNRAVKYLAWVAKPADGSHAVFTCNGGRGGLESDEVYGPIARAGLQFNGRDRLEARAGSFFRLHHPAERFGRAPSVGVYVYSFALDPLAADPSGAMHFSRVDSARLILDAKAAVLGHPAEAASDEQTLTGARALRVLEVFARTYNVFEIARGMGGMRWAS